MEGLNDIIWEEPGEWPLLIKIITAILICAVVWGAGYYFILQDKELEYKKLEQKEVALKKEFEKKQEKAINLGAYKAQLDEIKANFNVMLKQLPQKKEVSALLVDITRTGLVNGLDFVQFQPGSERPVEFYAELPINMKVTGSYHQLGRFISGLAALPRIVTIHNLSLSPLGADKLSMSVTAKTYRYFDETDK
jgi:type IV pilus assembly protein PilO